MDHEKYQRAKKQVADERGFYTHLVTYIGVSILFIVLDFRSGGVRWWYWPVIGWGIGLASHYLNVFGPSFLPGKKWEDRRIKELMEAEDEPRS